MWDFVVVLTLLVYSWGWNWWFLQLAPGNKARRGAPRHSLGRIPVHFETFQIQRNSSCLFWILGSNCNQISPIGALINLIPSPRRRSVLHPAWVLNGFAGWWTMMDCDDFLHKLLSSFLATFIRSCLRPCFGFGPPDNKIWRVTGWLTGPYDHQVPWATSWQVFGCQRLSSWNRNGCQLCQPMLSCQCTLWGRSDCHLKATQSIRKTLIKGMEAIHW